MNPIDNLKEDKPEYEPPVIAPQEATPMPPEEMQGGLPPSPIPEAVTPPPEQPVSAFQDMPSVVGGSTPTGAFQGLGPTTQQTLDAFVAPGVEQQIDQQQGLQERINQGVASATQENTFPNVYRPPNFDQLLNDFVGSASWQNRILQQQLRDADEQTRSNAEFAKHALEVLNNSPQNSSTGDAFSWVQEFLGMSGGEKERQYINPFSGTFAQGNAKWNIPATFLYGLGLAQNTVMGAALDLRNITAAGYNALAPWVRQQPDWVKNLLVGKEGTPDRALAKAVINWLNSPTNKRYNDGKSNTIEALRGAQYSFGDDAGAGLGIKANQGFRVGAEAGKGWGFDVNPSALLGFGLDVFVGMKVDRALGPMFGKGAKQSASQGTKVGPLRQGVDRMTARQKQASYAREADYLTAFPEVGKYKPPVRPTGRPIDYEQLELPFTPKFKDPKAKPTKPPKESAAFKKANREKAARIRKMEKAIQVSSDVVRQLDLDFGVDDLPEAAKPRLPRQPLPPTVKVQVNPRGSFDQTRRIQLDLPTLKEQRAAWVNAVPPATPTELAQQTMAKLPTYADWVATRETPLAQVLSVLDTQEPLARALAQMPPQTPLAQALNALPPETTVEQVLKVIPDATPLERALSQMPNDTPLQQALAQLDTPSITPLDQVLIQNLEASPFIDVGGIKVTTAPQRFTELVKRLDLLPSTGTNQLGSQYLDELAVRVGVDTIDEAAFALDDLLGGANPLTTSSVREALDNVPGVLTDSASAQKLADVVNITSQNQVLNRALAKADDAVKQAEVQLDLTPDIGRKFVGEVPTPATVNKPTPITSVGDLPLAKPVGQLYHGTRVKDHILFAADPMVGAARSELGTGHYLSTTKSGATLAARADTAVNIPTVATREFGQPNLIEATLDSGAKLIDANNKVGELSDLANKVGVNYPELAGKFNGKLSLVDVYDIASKNLDEVGALQFQRQMAQTLVDLGYDGARAGKTVVVYNNKVITQGATNVLKDTGTVGKRAARAALESNAVDDTGSEFAKAAAADAELGRATQVAEELEEFAHARAVETSEVIDRSDLWDDIDTLLDDTSETFDDAIEALHTPTMSDIDDVINKITNNDVLTSAEQALVPKLKELDTLNNRLSDLYNREANLRFEKNPEALLKEIEQVESEIDELLKKNPCEM